MLLGEKGFCKYSESCRNFLECCISAVYERISLFAGEQFFYDANDCLVLHICAKYFVWLLSCSVFPVILTSVWFVYMFPSLPTSQWNTFTFRSLQSSLASSKPSNLEPEWPGKTLSRRIHLSNPRASHFIACSLKACLMRFSKWRIALVDHHHTILCLPQANSGLSVLVKLVFEYIAFFCV